MILMRARAALPRMKSVDRRACVCEEAVGESNVARRLRLFEYSQDASMQAALILIVEDAIGDVRPDPEIHLARK